MNIMEKIMFGPHEEKKNGSHACFFKLTECIFLESSELPSGTKTGKNSLMRNGRQFKY